MKLKDSVYLKKKIITSIFILFIILFIILIILIFFKKEFFNISIKKPTFHILIATAGRPSLIKLLNSLKNELKKNDAIIIVFDGNDAKKKSEISNFLFNEQKSYINVIEQIPNLGYWGHGIRNMYQDILKPECTFIMHADDDDEYIQGSFNKLRQKCIDPNTLYFSKMIKFYKSGEFKIIPNDNQIIMNNIGTPNGIIPTLISKNGKWGYHYGGDYAYYNELKDFALNIVFLDEVIYKVNEK